MNEVIQADTLPQEQPPQVSQEQAVLQTQEAIAKVNINNLAESINPDVLQKMGSKVVEEYDNDIQSRREWEERRANWVKLFAGLKDKKNYPFKDASNVHVPLMGMACLQFQSRAYDALLPAKDVMTAYSTDGKSKAQAERVTKHMNWQLRFQMEEWEDDMDALLLSLAINGTAFKKTYYDPILKRTASRLLTVDELVLPYKCRRLEDSPRKTHAFYMSVNDLKIKESNQIFINAKDLKVNTVETPISSELNTAKKDITGISQGLMDEKPRLILEQTRLWDLNGDGIEENYVVTVDWETKKVLRVIPNIYIDYLTKQELPLEYYTVYTFIPNPDSVYGYGFGHLLEGLNESADTIINQLIDAGHLSNIGAFSGFVGRRSGIKKGDLQFKLGEFKEVDLLTDDIKKAIYNFEFGQPSNVLFSLLGMLEGYSQKITTVSETMMGELPPSDTTATATMAVLEQGMKVFSTIQRRIHKSFKKELKKIFIFNGLYLDEDIYFTVQDTESLSMAGYTAGKIDYLNMIDVIPVSDPNIISRAEKVAIAQQSYQMGLQNPLIMNDPETLAEITKEFYNAIGNERVAKLVKIPEPQVPKDIPPHEENAMFIKEIGMPALPIQNHREHLNIHGMFMSGGWKDFLTPQGNKLMEAHQKEHLSLLYLIREGMNNGMDARGMGGMEEQPINTGIPAGM